MNNSDHSGNHSLDLATALHHVEESNRFLSCILDHIGHALIATDNSGRITFVNRCSQELYGWDENILLDKNITEIILIPSSGTAPKDILGVLASENTWKGEVLIKCHDGNTLPASATAMPLRDQKGNHIGMIYRCINTVQDQSRNTVIQDRQNAEEVPASEGHYQLLFAANPLPMWVVDKQSLRFLAVNAAASAHYGYSTAEFLAMTIKDLHPSEDIAALLNVIETSDTNEQSISPWRHRRKDSSLIDVDIAANKMMFAGIPAWLILAHDISERVRTQREAAQINRAFQMLTLCNEALIRADNEYMLLSGICQIAIDIGGFLMSWIGYAIDDDNKSIIPQAWAGREDGYLSEIRLTWAADDIIGMGPAGQAIRTREPVNIPDITQADSGFYWINAAIGRGYHGVICLPLIIKNHLLGLFTLYYAQEKEVLPEEIRLLKELADNIAFGISTTRTHENQRRTHEAMIDMAQGVSASTGTDYFESLTYSMVKALGCDVGFIAKCATMKPEDIEILSAVVDGYSAPDFIFPFTEYPGNNHDANQIHIVTKDLRKIYPQSKQLAESGNDACMSTLLVDSTGACIGLIFALYRHSITPSEFLTSTLKIYAALAVNELEREKVETTLREQASLLDKAQDVILVRDLDNRITYWNDSAAKLYGWSKEEVLGQSIRDLLYHDNAGFDMAMKQLRKQGEWFGELNQVDRAGRDIIVECRWTLVCDDTGQPQSVLAINTNITERKKLEQQFLRAQRMESIGTLAGGIAHDLNNMLSPILMGIQLLKMGEKDAKRLTMIEMMESSAKRGADMVNQVLSYARGVEGRRMNVQVRHLLREIEKIINDTMLKNIQVRTEIVGEPWTIIGDPTQLHQVLLNLCVNARDAMPNGGVINLTAENQFLDDHYVAMNIDAKPGPHVIIQVRDSGNGIPADIMDKIFDPFFTTKELGKGTGLGLSTSLAIIKGHGGFMRVNSELGKGTTFRIYIPAHTQVTTDQEVSDSTALPHGKGELILVVDDETAVRNITQKTLETYGYRTLLAEDGAAAIAIFAKHKNEIDAVITDMMMPVMDGPKTIQVLQRMNPQLRIIGVSGLSSNQSTALKFGVRQFLLKPYTAETLLKTLDEVLRS